MAKHTNLKAAIHAFGDSHTMGNDNHNENVAHATIGSGIGDRGNSRESHSTNHANTRSRRMASHRQDGWNEKGCHDDHNLHRRHHPQHRTNKHQHQPNTMTSKSPQRHKAQHERWTAPLSPQAQHNMRRSRQSLQHQRLVSSPRGLGMASKHVIKGSSRTQPTVATEAEEESFTVNSDFSHQGGDSHINDNFNDNDDVTTDACQCSDHVDTLSDDCRAATNIRKQSSCNNTHNGDCSKQLGSNQGDFDEPHDHHHAARSATPSIRTGASITDDDASNRHLDRSPKRDVARRKRRGAGDVNDNDSIESHRDSSLSSHSSTNLLEDEFDDGVHGAGNDAQRKYRFKDRLHGTAPIVGNDIQNGSNIGNGDGNRNNRNSNRNSNNSAKARARSTGGRTRQKHPDVSSKNGSLSPSANTSNRSGRSRTNGPLHRHPSTTTQRPLTEAIIRAFFVDYYEDFSSIAPLKIRESWMAFFDKYYRPDYIMVRPSGNIISFLQLIDNFMSKELSLDEMLLMSIDNIHIFSGGAVATVVYTARQRFRYRGTPNCDRTVCTAVMECIDGEPKIVQEHRGTGQPIDQVEDNGDEEEKQQPEVAKDARVPGAKAATEPTVVANKLPGRFAPRNPLALSPSDTSLGPAPKRTNDVPPTMVRQQRDASVVEANVAITPQ